MENKKVKEKKSKYLGQRKRKGIVIQIMVQRKIFGKQLYTSSIRACIEKDSANGKLDEIKREKRHCFS